MPLTAEIVKAKARELGADGVGIADAAVLNAHPPDPAYPQTPVSVSPEIRSCVAFFKRIPAGAFRARDNACIHHVDQLVLREMDRVGYRIARFLEGNGHWAFQTAAQETVWEMKSASYGYLSTRHVAIEAGLGTIGFELNLLTKEAGPRCYTTVVLTDAVLEPDGKLTEQLCIGEPCSRCLYSCPPDAVQHWGLDKRRCATFAQEFGFSTILRVFSGFVGRDGANAKLGALAGHEWFGIWQGLLRVVGAFGDCPRCLAVPGRRGLQPVPEGRPARNSREDRREGRAGAAAARDQKARRADPRHGRWACALDRRGRLSPAGPAHRHSRVSLTAGAVKAKAKVLGADLVGIARGEVLDHHPPDPARPQTPSGITTDDSKSVVILARRLLTGINRLRGHDDRHKQYSTELVLTDLEEIELKLVYFLEDSGFPSITVPPVHFDPRHYDPKGDTRGPLSLAHAAVEAGLGTLGLNLMLLTPEYGPRVMLGAGRIRASAA